MQEIKIDELEKKIELGGKYFVEFFTNWCADCKMMEPVIKSLEKTMSVSNPDIKFISIDAEGANNFRKSDSKFQVLKVPSFFYINEGIITHLGYEYLPEETLIKKINECI